MAPQMGPRGGNRAVVISPYGDLVLEALSTLRPSFAHGPKAFSVFMEGLSLLHSPCLLSGQAS